MMNNNDQRERDLYDEINLNLARAAVNMQQAKEMASDSTKDILIVENSDTAYFVNLSDLHIPEGNMFYLAEVLKTLAKIPNLYFGFGGDQINNSIKNSVGDTHSEVINAQDQVKLLATVLRAADKEVPFLHRIAYIEAGNHENRTENQTSINPAYLLASELDLQHKYVKNVARVIFQTDKRENPEEKVYHVMVSTHAEQKPSKSGAQAELALVSDQDRGADIIINGHNHKIAFASAIKQFAVPNKAAKVQKNVVYANFGSAIAGGEYAERAGYPYPRIANMEILRMTNVGGQKKYDFMNFRSLVNIIAKEKLVEVEQAFKFLESRNYTSVAQIDRAYTATTKDLYKNITKSYKNDSAVREQLLKKTGISDRLYFVPLSGFMIGNEDRVINDKEINEKINILAKLNGSCKIVLNGDMVFYKKAFTLTNKNGNLLGEKFPEDTFSYIESLAKMLEPVKDKIVAYNSGFQEEKIMKYHSEALAKMAMIRLQMDEKLCYMPYNKIKMEAEKLKIQARKVEEYNKNVLSNAVQKAMKDLYKAIREALPHAVENYNLLDENQKEELLYKAVQKYQSLPSEGYINESGKHVKDSKVNQRADYLKTLLVPKLRAEGVLLSLAKDKAYINLKFPLEDIELRTPHENLVQHILCTLLGIDPNNIVINAKPNTTSHVVAKVKDDKNRTRSISFVGGNSKSLAGRASIEKMLRSKQSLMPGANVYYTNARLGKEFMILDKTFTTDPTNPTNKVMMDTIYISGGTFANGSENEIAPNKIYKLTAHTHKNEKTKGTGMYANADEPFNLCCESINYETVLLEDEMVSEIIKNQAKQSYLKVLVAFKQKQQQEQLDKKLKNFNKVFESPKPKQTKKSTPQEQAQTME